MLKQISAIRRPNDQSSTKFLSDLRAEALDQKAKPGVVGVVVGEVVARLRGDLSADGFLEVWWQNEFDPTSASVDAAIGGDNPDRTTWLTVEHVLKRPNWTDDPGARKVIGTAYRRDDFTPEEFFAYWWEIHAPISSRAAGLGGYVVSEVIARVGGTMDAEAFVEQWWPDEHTLDIAGASPEVATAWDDVKRYAKTTGTFWSVREHLVQTPTYEAPGLLEV